MPFIHSNLPINSYYYFLSQLNFQTWYKYIKEINFTDNWVLILKSVKIEALWIHYIGLGIWMVWEVRKGCQQQYRWAVGDIDGDVGYVSGVTEVVRDMAYCLKQVGGTFRNWNGENTIHFTNYVPCCCFRYAFCAEQRSPHWHCIIYVFASFARSPL